MMNDEQNNWPVCPICGECHQTIAPAAFHKELINNLKYQNEQLQLQIEQLVKEKEMFKTQSDRLFFIMENIVKNRNLKND